MAEEENQPRYNPSFSTNYSTYKQEQAREFEVSQQERMGAGELWDAVKESEWIGNRSERYEPFRTQGFEPGEDRFLDEERLSNELGNKYTQNEYDFIANSQNEDDYQARLNKVAEDRDLAQKIGNEGLRGMVYSMLAGMLDPALLPLYIGTGGTGIAGRAALLTRTLRAGSLGAAEGAAVESVLSGMDTQRDWRDVVMAGATGGIVSGSIPLGVSGYKRIRHGKQPKPNNRLQEEPWLAESAKGVDGDLTRMMKDYREDQSAKVLEDNLKIETITSISPRQTLVDELLPIAQGRMSRGQRNELNSESRSLENQIKQLRDEADKAESPQVGGTSRQRKASADAKRARLQELQAKMEPLQRRVQEIEDTFNEDLPAREAWADLSRLANGQVPKRYRQRYDEIQKEDISPLNRNESRRVREAAQAASEIRQRQAEAEAQAEVRRPQGEAREDTASVGAARVEGASDPQDAYPVSGSVDVEEKLFDMERVGAALAPRDRIRRMAGGGIRRLSSTYSRLVGSESNLMKGLAHTLLSDPQAATRGHIAAAHRVANIHDRLIAAEGGREAVARDAWAKEQGISRVRMQMGEESIVKDFDNAVVLHIRGIDQGSEAIQAAAEARRDVLKESLRIRKESGEAGFENVEDNEAYWSFIPDFHKMQEMVARTNADQVVDLLTGAYMNGRFKLNENTAKMVAQTVYRRTMRQGLTAEGAFKSDLSKADLASLRADMEQAGVPARQIDDFLETLESEELAEGISDRAKLSLGASMTYRSDSGIRMVDVLDTSINVTTKYAQEAAAGAALARSGFKSRVDAERTIDEAEATAKNSLYEEAQESGVRVREEVEYVRDKGNKGKTKKVVSYVVVRGGKEQKVSQAAVKKQPVKVRDIINRANELGEQAQTLRDSIKLMYGESLDADISVATKASRQVRKATNLVALQWNGFASVGEASNQLVNMGIVSTIRNTKAKDFLSIGKIRKSEDLQGMYKLVGAYGQFGSAIKGNNYTLQTMDELNQSRIERIYNNGVGWVSNKSQLLSGFRSVQHGLENVLLRSMQARMVRIADGKIKPKQRDFDEMERAGLSREQVNEVLESIKKNPEYVEVDGERVRVFSGEKLSPELREDLGTAMTTMLSRNMQRSFVGETPIWMSKELGKLATQFRSFSIVSIEKQLAAGLRGDKIGMFLKTMFGLMLGTTSYTSRAWVRSQLEDDPEERWEMYTEPAMLATGVINMTPHLGLAGMGMEFAFMTNLISSEGGSVASRSGGRPLTIEGLIPGLGVSMDAANLIAKGPGKLLHAEDSEERWEVYKEAMGMMPLVSSAALGTAIAIGDNAVNN